MPGWSGFSHGIRVNAVCPGLVATDLNSRDLSEPEFRERRLARIPLREIGTPEDVASAVVFLSSTADARLGPLRRWRQIDLERLNP